MSTGIIIDIIVIAILLVNICLGYKKGLVNAIFSIFAFIVAAVITAILYTPVTNLVINNTEIDDKVESTVYNALSTNEDEDGEESESNILLDYLYENVREISAVARDEAITVASEYISVSAIKLIVALALFAIVRIAVLLLKFVVEGIAELPIIKQFNEIGGIIYGLLKGLIIVFVVLTILLMISLVGSNSFISNALDTSYISKFICENIILKIVAF